MDPTTFVPYPMAPPDSLERDLIEIDAAIVLVAAGVATRVRLIGLKRPDGALALGLAHAQQANVAFTLDRDPRGATSLTLGPCM